MPTTDVPSPDAPRPLDDDGFARLSRAGVLGGFVALACAFSWIIWLAGIVAVRPGSIGDEAFAPFLIVGSFGPTLAAVVVLSIAGGWSAIRWLLRRFGRIRARWWVWMVVFFALPVTYAMVLLALGVRPQIEWWMLALTLAVVPINAVLVGVLFGVGPLGEEAGWRGLLSPTLDRAGGRVRASLVVGVIWAGWHAPLALFDDWRGDVALAIFAVSYPITLIAFSFALIWVMRWSRDSLLFAVLFHGVFNLTASLMNDPDLWNFAGVSAELRTIAGVTTVLMVAAGCEALGRTRASDGAIVALAARAAARQARST